MSNITVYAISIFIPLFRIIDKYGFELIVNNYFLIGAVLTLPINYKICKYVTNKWRDKYGVRNVSYGVGISVFVLMYIYSIPPFLAWMMAYDYDMQNNIRYFYIGASHQVWVLLFIFLFKYNERWILPKSSN